MKFRVFRPWPLRQYWTIAYDQWSQRYAEAVYRTELDLAVTAKQAADRCLLEGIRTQRRSFAKFIIIVSCVALSVVAAVLTEGSRMWTALGTYLVCAGLCVASLVRDWRDGIRLLRSISKSGDPVTPP